MLLSHLLAIAPVASGMVGAGGGRDRAAADRPGAHVPEADTNTSTSTATGAETAAGTGGEAAAEPGDFAERVLDVVERIPPGRVMSYGDVAEYLEEAGPRQVGRVMSMWGGAVPWWRVIRADGSPPPGLEVEALQNYAAEATPLRPNAARVDMRRARWDGA